MTSSESWAERCPARGFELGAPTIPWSGTGTSARSRPCSEFRSPPKSGPTRSGSSSRCARIHGTAFRGPLPSRHSAPKRVFTDNGSEFSGRMFDLWAYHHGVRIDFSRPGKPTHNCFIESFNGSLRDECLNVHWFESMEEARARIEAWRIDYNESRPHQALQEETPAQFAMRAKELERLVSFPTAEN